MVIARFFLLTFEAQIEVCKADCFPNWIESKIEQIKLQCNFWLQLNCWVFWKVFFLILIYFLVSSCSLLLSVKFLYWKFLYIFLPFLMKLKWTFPIEKLHPKLHKNLSSLFNKTSVFLLWSRTKPTNLTGFLVKWSHKIHKNRIQFWLKLKQPQAIISQWFILAIWKFIRTFNFSHQNIYLAQEFEFKEMFSMKWIKLKFLPILCGGTGDQAQ